MELEMILWFSIESCFRNKCKLFQGNYCSIKLGKFINDVFNR